MLSLSRANKKSPGKSSNNPGIIVKKKSIARKSLIRPTGIALLHNGFPAIGNPQGFGDLEGVVLTLDAGIDENNIGILKGRL